MVTQSNFNLSSTCVGAPEFSDDSHVREVAVLRQCVRGNVVNVPMSDGFCVSVFSIESMFAATTLCGLGHVQKFLHVSCD